MKVPSKGNAGRGSAKVVDIRRTSDIRRPGDTRQRVLHVAQALFAERGYRGTSLRDIAKRIGIKAPSLLHHFPSKQQLYVAVLDNMFESLENAANAIAWGRDDRQERMRRAIVDAIDFIVSHPAFVGLMSKEMADESGVGRQILKRRVPPLFTIAVNFILLGQRDGDFRAEVDPLHFMWSLNLITLGHFNTAAMSRRLWNLNLLEPAMIERRKREVIDMVERTLFTGPRPQQSSHPKENKPE
ncbi:MAG: transcriptional regulator, TetR family [Candidatus Binatus sp.]|nr:transcriptional regulator, TetR family [Candidatus Binatus sp.]